MLNISDYNFTGVNFDIVADAAAFLADQMNEYTEEEIKNTENYEELASNIVHVDKKGKWVVEMEIAKCEDGPDPEVWIILTQYKNLKTGEIVDSYVFDRTISWTPDVDMIELAVELFKCNGINVY